MTGDRPNPRPAADIRAAVRELCGDLCGKRPENSAEWIETHWTCYRRVREALGLTRSFRERDRGLVASECRRIKDETKGA